jgi:hypothetical protein
MAAGAAGAVREAAQPAHQVLLTETGYQLLSIYPLGQRPGA